MERTLIRGNKALAKTLGVCEKTVGRWKSEGVLDNAKVSEFGRIIIYDLDRVLQALNHHQTKPGRKKS